jgi:hypothetical protein
MNERPGTILVAGAIGSHGGSTLRHSGRIEETQLEQANARDEGSIWMEREQV